MTYFRKRPLLTILSSIILAFLIAFFLPNDWKLPLSGAALLALLALCLFKKTRKMSAMILIPFILAMLNHYAFVQFSYFPMSRFQGKEIEIQGRTVTEQRVSTNSSYFVLRPDAILHNGTSYRVSGDVVVYFEKTENEIPIGSKISCKGTAFEDENEGFSINYRITEKQFLSVYATKFKTLDQPAKLDIYVLTATARQKVMNLYERIFDEKAFALISGITLGEKDAIDAETYANFKNSGVSHTLAISGMHLTFLTAILWCILAAVCPNLYLRAALQLILIWAFTALTGFSPSCCRAAIMLSVCQFGILVHKEADTLTSLALAVVVCCVSNPFAILNPSLALSASSTLGLLLLGGPILKLFPKINRKVFGSKILRFAFQTTAMSVAATIGTFPIMVMMFQSISLLSPITNILIIPIIELLFIFGFMAVVLGWISPLAYVLRFVGEWAAEYCSFVTAQIAKLPFSTAYTGSLWFWIIFAILLFLFLLIFFLLRKKQKYILPCCLAVLVILITGSYLYDYSLRSLIEVEIVDVGQGNTAIIHRGHDAVLVDCGGSGTGYNSIEKELLRNNIKTISAIFVTHFDSDHVRYGVRLLNTYPVKHLYLPRREKYPEAAYALMHAASKRNTDITFIGEDHYIGLWDLGSISAFTKHIDPLSDDENENSLVYQLDYGDTEILFTGDVRKEGEERLVSSYREKLASEIFVVAHHGALNSSSVDFLGYVDAEVAVISVEKDNMYGLPKEVVVKRLKEYVTFLLRTDELGTVGFVLDGKDYRRKD